jgi:hypothetical protein
MHSAAGAYLINIPDHITDSIMVEVNPMLHMGTMAIADVVNGLEEIGSQKNGELARINLVIYVSF